MQLLPDDYAPPQTSMRIALRRNDSTNSKAPKLVGYVLTNRRQLEEVLADCPESDSMFLRVALWDARQPDAKYPLDGTVGVNSYKPTPEDTGEVSPPAKPEVSAWY